MPNSLKSRLKGLVRKGLLSEKDLSRIYTDNDVVAELEKIKTEIGAKVFEIQPTSDKYFDGVDDVMDIVSSIIDKHIKENKQ